MLKLHSPGEHGGAAGLIKKRKCWERSKEVGAGCFQPAFILCFSHKLIFEGTSVMPTESGCSFCPTFSDDVHTVSADAHFPFSGRSFRKKCVSGELRGNEAEPQPSAQAQPLLLDPTGRPPSRTPGRAMCPTRALPRSGAGTRKQGHGDTGREKKKKWCFRPVSNRGPFAC